ncbi:putative Phospholipase B [Blattamonas nauphoetae]|uniref:Phospholipase B-like n=1 Tax=Blattamonas nauphoetae TaxID=2049346 RepID=A0ABQ9Y085_9EUKA|nr:putative Phospholipase B [Blattamonas nauphoetae]
MICFLSLIVIYLSHAKPYSYVCEGADCKVIEGIDEKALAIADYTEQSAVDGWDRLDLNISKPEFALTDFYALGYLEGSLLQPKIFSLFTNLMEDLKRRQFDGKLPDEFSTFMEKNYDYFLEYLRDKTSEAVPDMIEALYEQTRGVADGYNAIAKEEEKLTPHQLYLLQCMSDLPGLIRDFTTAPEGITSEKLDSYILQSAHGTILLEEQGKKELFTTHTTNTNYGLMIRVLKRVKYVAPNKTVRTVSYTGYPGVVDLYDSFCITDGLLAIAGTSVYSLAGLTKPTAADDDKHKRLPTWAQVMASTVLSSTSADFAQTLGTLSPLVPRHFACVDYNKYKAKKAGKPMTASTIMLIEQSLKTTKVLDITADITKKEYIVLVNTPYDADIAKDLEYEQFIGEDALRKYHFHPQTNCRMQLSGKIGKKTHTIKTAKYNLRYNNWVSDAESIDSNGNRDPLVGMSPRCELRDSAHQTPIAYGGIDAKITTLVLIEQFSFISVAGLSYSHMLPKLSLDDINKRAAFSFNGIAPLKKNVWVTFRDTDVIIEHLEPFVLIGSIGSGAAAVLGTIVLIIVMLILKFTKGTRNGVKYEKMKD